MKLWESFYISNTNWEIIHNKNLHTLFCFIVFTPQTFSFVNLHDLGLRIAAVTLQLALVLVRSTVTSAQRLVD